MGAIAPCPNVEPCLVCATASEIYHELHVAGSRGFSTSGRYLLTQICAGYDPLSQRNTVVFQVDTFQPATNYWVAVYSSCDIVEQFDNELRGVVAWSSLHV